MRGEWRLLLLFLGPGVGEDDDDDAEDEDEGGEGECVGRRDISVKEEHQMTRITAMIIRTIIGAGYLRKGSRCW